MPSLNLGILNSHSNVYYNYFHKIFGVPAFRQAREDGVLGENAASFILSRYNNVTSRRAGKAGYVTVDLKILYRSRVSVAYSEQLARLAERRGLGGSNLPVCVFPKVAKFDSAISLVFILTVFIIGTTIAVILVVIVAVVERLYTLRPASAVIGCRLDDVGSICSRYVRFKSFWGISRRPSSGFVTL
jgi:hypothetical protein